MLAQSFLQPWLWLLLKGFKDVENRDQPPWAKALGQRIALHASRGWDDDAVGFARELVSDQVANLTAAAPRGAIVGTAVLAGAVLVRPTDDTCDHLQEVRRVGDLSDDQVKRVLESKWTFGKWGLVYVDRRELVEPVPCRGALGYWQVPEDLVERIRDGAARPGATP
jgi:hypothetical protein